MAEKGGLQRLSTSAPERDCSDVRHNTRSGNTLTTVGHIITANVGAGVLNLPYAIAMMGWVGGPLFLLLFAGITQYTSQLLADCGVIRGVRQTTYTNVVNTTFGRWGLISVGWIQHVNLILVTLAFQITGGLSLQTVAKSICASTGASSCIDQYWEWAVIFAAAEFVLVQMPDLSSFWWASIIGAVMSFGYSGIALGLSIAQGNTHGTVSGKDLTPSGKAFGILNSIGSMTFAYSFSMILIEIQDTIKATPKKTPVQSMQAAIKISVEIMTFFYLAVAIAGYMAFGNNVPEQLLMGFSHPHWLIDAANLMVVIHMLPAYQVFSQPFLMFTEGHYERWNRVPAALKGWTFRVIFRSVYVLLIGFLGVCLPFFGDIVGFAGAIGFWPATVFFPIECWIKINQPSRQTRFWLRSLNIGCFIITLAATIGSVQLIVVDSSKYTIFEG